MNTRKLLQSRSKLDRAIIASILATLGVNLLYLATQLQAAPALAVIPTAGGLA
ncbi:hypothetical protein [Pseudoblastomonas halimionae]|uniref:Uncharacterized protein n=1 Tax=Alteriqipengyuania halimionae TaxID=1926630 RepID=A0A6I4TZ61_9SPHN|nr:hypothetical protein [Alteriqipengyuania halimionae]MXP08918.1 hypothetical protein [Alteriqipengyuania halimionae]